MTVSAKTITNLVKAKALIEQRKPQRTVVAFFVGTEEDKARVEKAAAGLGLPKENFRVLLPGSNAW